MCRKNDTCAQTPSATFSLSEMLHLEFERKKLSRMPAGSENK
jgi:hypothetical protein